MHLCIRGTDFFLLDSGTVPIMCCFFVFISNKFSSHCDSVIFTIFTNNKTYEYSFDAIDLLKIKITDREILASLKKAINSHQSKSSFDIVNLLL